MLGVCDEAFMLYLRYKDLCPIPCCVSELFSFIVASTGFYNVASGCYPNNHTRCTIMRFCYVERSTYNLEPTWPLFRWPVPPGPVSTTIVKCDLLCFQPRDSISTIHHRTDVDGHYATTYVMAAGPTRCLQRWPRSLWRAQAFRPDLTNRRSTYFQEPTATRQFVQAQENTGRLTPFGGASSTMRRCALW